MGRGGFGKGKYKKIIKSIYPLTPDGDIQVHNIGKLVHFCQISPTKLIKVAAYVEKKTNSDLTKSKLRFVGASMKIFQDLIKGCRKNLNLFSNNVLRLIKLLLECSFPKLKIIATETFIQFAEVLDENTPYPELEGLVPYLIDMCQNQIRDAIVRNRLKQDGLKSIRAYIRVLEMTDELDGFITRHSDEDNWAVFLPAILDNLELPIPSTSSDAHDPAQPPINTATNLPVNTTAINTPATSLRAAEPPSYNLNASQPTVIQSHTVTTSNLNLSPDPDPDPNPNPNPNTNLTPAIQPLSLATTTPYPLAVEGSEDEAHSVGTDTTTNVQLHAAHPLADTDGESIHALATELLRDIFSRANISVTSMFKAILRYLEFRHKWTPNTFAVYIIQSIYDCLKVQHGQILITLLLQHAELPHHTITVKAQIFMTTTQFFTESTGYFMQILDSLVKHMVSSVEFTSQDQQVVDNDNPHLAFQGDMIACMGVLCNKISQQQKLDAFSALCTRLSMSKHVSSSGLSGVVVIFAHAILQVTLCIRNFPVQLLVPYLRLFQELSMHNNNDVRSFVQKIFQSILLPGYGSQQQNTHLSPPKIDEVIHEQVALVIRGTLYFQIKMRLKHAENYVAVYNTLRAMLFRGGKHDLVESFPLVFSIQKFATKWKKIPPIRAYTIHTLAAAYLYCVAYLFRCEALETLVDTVVQERERKGQVCPLVLIQKRPVPALILSSTAEFSLAPQKKVAVEYVLFDRQSIVDILFSENSSTLSSEKQFSKSLMKKFRNQGDTITPIITETASTIVETSHHQPPSPLASTMVSASEQDSIVDIIPSKSVAVFSSDHTVAPIDDLDKLHRSSRIDVISMRRALVVGLPSMHVIRKHSASYGTVITNYNQKISYSKETMLLATKFINERASWNVFDLDLSSTLKMDIY